MRRNPLKQNTKHRFVYRMVEKIAQRVEIEQEIFRVKR
jgi:hypothetical protein